MLDQDPSTVLGLIAKKQRALADEIESYLKDSSVHSSAPGIVQPTLEDQQNFLSGDTSEVKGKKSKGKGN